MSEPVSPRKVAFLGLGVMGGPMARHLAAAGHDVTVFNRSTDKATAWAATNGGSTATTPREAAKRAEIVFLCVGNDNDVRSVVYGESGALAGMARGAILVDHTTASADVAREIYGASAAIGVFTFCPKKSLRRGKTLFILGCTQLPRGLRSPCDKWHLVQSRISTPRRNFCNSQNNNGGCPNQTRTSVKTISRQPRRGS